MMQMLNESAGSRPEKLTRVRELMRTALVSAVDQHAAAKQAADRALADPLREACIAAHAEELRAEQLLIILKQSWRELADERVLTRVDADVTLSDIVTRCIKEYYRPDPGL